MAIRVEKPAFNMREKLTELDSASISYERMPKGSIIQVQHKYFPGYTSVGTNNSPIKFFDLNIYPKRKRSKFLVNAIVYYSHGGMGNQNADGYDYFFFLYNNEQPIHQNSNLSRAFNGQNGGNAAWYKTDVPISDNDVDHSYQYFAIHENVQMLDDPQDYEVGEPINYSLRIMCQNTLTLNRANHSSGSSGGTSSMTIMEVAS
tara:strand:+ start:2469 stop:3077 length:609 start_codon:yes stop_codon:yes gene_type:complete